MTLSLSLFINEINDIINNYYKSEYFTIELYKYNETKINFYFFNKIDELYELGPLKNSTTFRDLFDSIQTRFALYGCNRRLSRPGFDDGYYTMYENQKIIDSYKITDCTYDNWNIMFKASYFSKCYLFTINKLILNSHVSN